MGELSRGQEAWRARERSERVDSRKASLQSQPMEISATQQQTLPRRAVSVPVPRNSSASASRSDHYTPASFLAAMWSDDEEPASFSPSPLASSVVFSASSSRKKRRMRRQRSSPQLDSEIMTQPAVVSGKDCLSAFSELQSVTPETESKVSMGSGSDITVSVNAEAAKLKTVVSETIFSSPRDLRGSLHAPSESRDALKGTVNTDSRIGDASPVFQGTATPSGASPEAEPPSSADSGPLEVKEPGQVVQEQSPFPLLAQPLAQSPASAAHLPLAQLPAQVAGQLLAPPPIQPSPSPTPVQQAMSVQPIKDSSTTFSSKQTRKDCFGPSRAGPFRSSYSLQGLPRD